MISTDYYECYPAYCIDKEPPAYGRLPAALRLPIQLRGGLPQRLVGYYCQTSATPPLLLGWRIYEARRSWDGVILACPKVSHNQGRLSMVTFMVENILHRLAVPIPSLRVFFHGHPGYCG